MAVTYLKWPYNTYTNIFHSNALQNRYTQIGMKINHLATLDLSPVLKPFKLLELLWLLYNSGMPERCKDEGQIQKEGSSN
jgi:hypothetical protein